MCRYKSIVGSFYRSASCEPTICGIGIGIGIGIGANVSTVLTQQMIPSRKVLLALALLASIQQNLFTSNNRL
ncbi:MAG: hypothetical protein ACI9WS_003123 [Paraglaciecola psychrophila]|jgi:hypothetical protein